MNNKINTSDGNIQLVSAEGKVINVSPSSVYTSWNDETVSVILIDFAKSSGLAIFTSMAKDLEINGTVYTDPEDAQEALAEAIADAGGAGNVKVEVVEELPQEGEENTIYLVPAESGSTGDLYEEYVWVDGDWEKFGSGSIEIDLSDYWTSAQTESAIEAAVSGKADVSAVTAVNDTLTAHTADTTIHVTSTDKTNWDGKQDALANASVLSGITAQDIADWDAVSGKADTTTVAATYATKAEVIANEQVVSTALNGLELNKADTSAVTASIDAAVSGKADASQIEGFSTEYVDGNNSSMTMKIGENEYDQLTVEMQYLGGGTSKADVSFGDTGNDIEFHANIIGETVADADGNVLSDKLDATAYTPTDLSEYWTSAQTNSAIAAAVSGKADAADLEQFEADLSGLTISHTDVNSTYVGQLIGTDQTFEISINEDVTIDDQTQESEAHIEISTNANSTNVDVLGNLSAAYVYATNIPDVEGLSTVVTADSASTIVMEVGVEPDVATGDIVYGNIEVSRIDDPNSSPALTYTFDGDVVDGSGNILANKQDTLIAGSGITISGNVISADGGGSSVTVDPAMDATSPNPVANSAVTNTILDDEYTIAQALTQLSNGLADCVDSATLDAALSGKADTSAVTASLADKLDVTAYTQVTVDSTLTSGSTNPVESAAIWEQFGGLKLAKVTQQEYDDMVSGGTINSDTLYIIGNAVQ